MTDRLPIEFERVELNESEKRELERLKEVVDVISDEVVLVDGIKTVLAEIEGERVNVAIPPSGLVETIPTDVF